MNVEELKQFAIEHEIEWPQNDELSDAVLELNRNVEVTHKIYNLTTDEIEIMVHFVDVKTSERKFLGIISGANTFTFLEQSGIQFPDTF